MYLGLKEMAHEKLRYGLLSGVLSTNCPRRLYVSGPC